MGMNRVQTAANARAAQSAKRAKRVEMLGDLVADGMTIRAAAKQMGIAESTALNYWADIKRETGQ